MYLGDGESVSGHTNSNNQTMNVGIFQKKSKAAAFYDFGMYLGDSEGISGLYKSLNVGAFFKCSFSEIFETVHGYPNWAMQIHTSFNGLDSLPRAQKLGKTTTNKQYPEKNS